MYRVYPRACGETTLSHPNLIAAWGLSPRLRGNPGKRPDLRHPARSIPAPAGKPQPFTVMEDNYGVYPRACGETDALVNPAPVPSGLSPRLRGNRDHEQRRLRAGGSIPAPAGKPPSKRAGPRQRTVYPRACGETARSGPKARFTAGLSPRLRGNLRVDGRPRLPRGSIPAPAGKPLSASWPQLLVPV